MPIRAGMKPAWSPSPCTDGASRTTDERTPRSASAIAAFSDATLGTAGSGTSSSVARRPSPASISVPEVIAKGLPEPSSAAPIVSTARRSAWHAAAKSFVNSVFEPLMREEIGGVRYDAEARLQFGAPDGRAELSAAKNPAPRAELLLRFKKGL